MMSPFPAVGHTLAIFGLGHWEILLIVGVLFLLFGAARIPEMMRSLGKGVTEFKKGMNDSTADGDKKLPGPDEKTSDKS
jgi:sec-independent protein translocase protein TatA